MLTMLRNLLLAGLGAAAGTYDRARVLVEEMIARGELTLGQGREIDEELRRVWTNREQPDGTKAARADDNAVEDRLRRIEEKLDILLRRDRGGHA